MTRPHLLVLAFVTGLARSASADPPRILVLPLPARGAVDPDVARAFDARLLVALDDTRRVTTVTLDEELDCTTPKCLADAATAANAGSVLAISLVRETGRLALFATLLDARTARPAARAELADIAEIELATAVPAALAQRMFGAAPGPAIVGVAEHGRTAGTASALSSRLAALGTFTVAPATRSGASFTHRADVTVSELSIVKRRHHVHRYLDGVLVGTLSIVDLGAKRVVFTKTVKVTASRRARHSSEAEVTALIVEAAVQDWMTAFHAARTETLLKGDLK
jgi:hypothetical protein